ncbi:MAG TPA: serine/threonine-protein kinase [Trebonia sp.]
MPLQQGDPPQVGRYRLTARLGAGGMGVVYLGHAGDGQQLAVKVLRPEYADDPEFRARFQREVAAMTRVRNRYTVQVLDADTDSVTPFIATQFADGPSLSEHVNAQGPLYPEAVIRLAAALAEAIAAIHAAGVTHRDLKPSNVLLTSAGPMVIDFGIAQVADSASITRTGMAVGSPGYMAPEQVTGHAGREADIFTWALIVAFAASGRPPFGTGETVGILHRILNESPDVSAVPPQLMPLVSAALAKDPQRRPRAVDLLGELSPGSAAGMTPPTAVDRGMAPRTAVDRQAGTRLDYSAGTRTMPAGAGPRPAPGPRPGPAPRRSFRGLAVAALVVAALAGTGAALMSHGGSQSGNNPSGGGLNVTPSATAPAQSGNGSVTDTGAPATQAATGQPTSPGQFKKHKHHDSTSGDSGSGSGSGGQSVPTSAPSSNPVSTPSATASAGTGPSAGPTSSSTAGTGAGGTGGTGG